LSTNNVFLSCFGTVATALGPRFRPQLRRLMAFLYNGLASMDKRLRQQAADLVPKIAGAFSVCHEEDALLRVTATLNESLGGVFPEVLGSILGALKAIVSVVGVQRMKPPPSDLLPRLTPILRNRHEKVAENCIDLVGRIAERSAESVQCRLASGCGSASSCWTC
jgi:splicing factor 3B subunit 1